MTLPTLADLQARFLADISQQNTQASYRNGLSQLMTFLVETGYAGLTAEDTPAATVLHDDILVVFYRWLNEQYSPHTIQTYMAALQRFLVWLDAADLLAPDFQLGKAQSRLKAVRGERGALAYKHRRPDPALPSVVTYYDHLPLPESNPAKRLEILRSRAIVHTLYASAGRVSEVAGLTREQVLDGRVDEVQIVGKGNKTRIILLTRQAMQAIRAYLKARDDRYAPLFIGHGNRSRGQPLSRQAIWKVVKQAALALDLHEATSPHAFRHFRASQLLNEGMPLELVQAYLGHADIGTTRKIYAHTRTSVLRQQLEAYDQSPEEALASLEQRRGEGNVGQT